ncbi:LysR family transcriptional regulator ArgP [Nioella aestuarii]|uniref:LysR family transcriptional regulator ArgP n=1 Tax=Nioella aestuarii TaxID=1662864 RepID=UPI003D7FD8E3
MKLDYDALAALAAILHTGSFAGAAQKLGLTQPAITQRIKLLEDRIGTILIRRSRPCTATEAGARLLRHAEEVGLLEKTLAQDLAGFAPDPDRPLRIVVNADSLATWALPALTAAKGFLFDITVDDQDHSADLLRAGEVMGAITSHGRAIAGCDPHPLGALDYAVTCTPAFAAQWFATGVTAETLARAPCLTFNRKDRLQRDWADEVAGTRLSVPSHYLPTTQGITDAIRLSLGWGANPVILFEPFLSRGELVELIPGRRFSTPLFWQVSHQAAPALRELTQALKRHAAAFLRAPHS